MDDNSSFQRRIYCLRFCSEYKVTCVYIQFKNVGIYRQVLILMYVIVHILLIETYRVKHEAIIVLYNLCCQRVYNWVVKTFNGIYNNTMRLIWRATSVVAHGCSPRSIYRGCSSRLERNDNAIIIIYAVAVELEIK